MKNTLPFDDFLQTLRATNRDLSFFVDWDKCLTNKDALRISLNHLNLLLGMEKEDLQEKINLLFSEYPKAFAALPLILAIRNERELVLDSKGSEKPINAYLDSVQGIYEFICESGLDSVFGDRNIKDFNDFVFGYKKEFIVAAFDGFSYDNDDSQMENLQILDFIHANNTDEARAIVNDKYYGKYEKLVFYEVMR